MLVQKDEIIRRSNELLDDADYVGEEDLRARLSTMHMLVGFALDLYDEAVDLNEECDDESDDPYELCLNGVDHN